MQSTTCVVMSVLTKQPRSQISLQLLRPML